MAENKFTPEGLPIISEEVIGTSHRDAKMRIAEATKGTGEEVVPRNLGELKNDLLDHMRDHNRALYALYQSHDEVRKNCEREGESDEAVYIHHYQAGLLNMYNLFLNQAEVNQLDQLE